MFRDIWENIAAPKQNQTPMERKQWKKQKKDLEIKSDFQNNFHGNNRMDMFEIWFVIQKMKSSKPMRM